MNWFYVNGKPFILTEEERARVIQGPFQSDPDNNVVLVLPVPLYGVDEGLKNRLLPTDQYQHHRFQTSVAPLALYPPQGPNFGFTYGMVQHTPPSSLFDSGPGGSDYHDEDEDDVGAFEDENDDMTTTHLFKEIHEETVVHHLV
ncbi:hypothetical protein V6N13_039993 [Hibiscus sabdariffa]